MTSEDLHAFLQVSYKIPFIPTAVLYGKSTWGDKSMKGDEFQSPESPVADWLSPPPPPQPQLRIQLNGLDVRLCCSDPSTFHLYCQTASTSSTTASETAAPTWLRPSWSLYLRFHQINEFGSNQSHAHLGCLSFFLLSSIPNLHGGGWVSAL